MFRCQELARSLCFNVANATRDKKLYNENLLISQFTTDGTSVSTFTTEDLYDFLITYNKIFLSKLKEQQMNEMECEGHYFGFHLLFDFRAKSSKNDCNTS